MALLFPILRSLTLLSCLALGACANQDKTDLSRIVHNAEEENLRTMPEPVRPFKQYTTRLHTFISPGSMSDEKHRIEYPDVVGPDDTLHITNCNLNPNVLTKVTAYRVLKKDGSNPDKELYFPSYFLTGKKTVLVDHYRIFMDGKLYFTEQNVEQIIATSCRKEHPSRDWAGLNLGEADIR